MGSKLPRWLWTGLFKRKSSLPLAAKTQTKAGSKAKGTGEANPYHAVSIIPGLKACAAAYRFTGQRFLSRQAPKLPLPTCDLAYCTCRFKHHQDRRAGPRRRGEIGMLQGLWNGPERRRAGGRRADDA